MIGLLKAREESDFASQNPTSARTVSAGITMMSPTGNSAASAAPYFHLVDRHSTKDWKVRPRIATRP